MGTASASESISGRSSPSLRRSRRVPMSWARRGCARGQPSRPLRPVPLGLLASLHTQPSAASIRGGPSGSESPSDTFPIPRAAPTPPPTPGAPPATNTADTLLLFLRDVVFSGGAVERHGVTSTLADLGKSANSSKLLLWKTST